MHSRSIQELQQPTSTASGLRTTEASRNYNSPTSTASGLRTTEASRNYNSQHLQHPGFAQPKHPGTTTANIYSIRASHNRSIQELQQPTSTASGLRTTEAFRNYNSQHLQCPSFEASSNRDSQHLQHPGFAQQVSRQLKLSASTASKLLTGRSVHQSHSPAFEMSNLRTEATPENEAAALRCARSGGGPPEKIGGRMSIIIWTVSSKSNSCRRCGGSLSLRDDQFGTYLQCLMCGRSTDIHRPREDRPTGPTPSSAHPS